jgi:hypothetical protein
MNPLKGSCAALVGLLAIGAALADPSAAPSALRSAKTISVHEDILMYGSDGKARPFFHETVLIRRPGQIHVVIGQDQPGRKPHLYVADGKIEREYNALTNTYNTVKPRPDGRSMSELRDISQIELILDAGPPAAEKDSQRTVTSETLDGKAMTLTTDTSPARMGHDGASYTTLTKTWMDATTGLPYRRMTLSSKDGGPPTPLNEQDFSGWVLNQPIPNARMAWAPPAGAKPYTEPTLLAVGTPAPDFAVVTPDGRTVHLSDYKKDGRSGLLGHLVWTVSGIDAALGARLSAGQGQERGRAGCLRMGRQSCLRQVASCTYWERLQFPGGIRPRWARPQEHCPELVQSHRYPDSVCDR